MNQISKDRAEYQVIFKNKEIKSILITAERAANIMKDLGKVSFIAIQDIDGSVHGVNSREIERVCPIGKEDRESYAKKYQVYLKDFDLGWGKLHDGTEVPVIRVERRYIHTDEKISEYYGYLKGSHIWPSDCHQVSVSEAQEILSRK